MNKNNLKLIMELIFIFILPLVFICFTSKIQIERNFEYDNNGNYETSQDTKSLSFNNSIIKYENDYNKLSNLNQFFIKDNYIIKFNYDLYNEIYEFRINIIDLTNRNIIIHGGSGYDIICRVNLSDNHLYFNYYYSANRDLSQNTSINAYDLVRTDTNFYYFERVDNIEIIDNITNNQIRDWTTINSYEIQYSSVSIWGNIKELLINNLNLNDNVLLDIVICYTILWVIMWIIWHLFYGLFELLWHVIPSPLERRL